MIVYDKSWWGDAVIVRMYGSAFPRALPYSLGACVLAAALSFWFKGELDQQFVAPYPFQTFAFIVGSLVVFRSQLSYNRYWEGRTQLQRMSSRLTDAVVLAVNFDREAVPKVNPTTQQVKDHQWFRDTIVHLASLLHGVALATLRTDCNMENLVAHDSLRQAPNYNVRKEMKHFASNGLDSDSVSNSGSDPGPKGIAEKVTKQAKKRLLFTTSALPFSSKPPGKLPGAFTAHPDNMPAPAKWDKAYQGRAPASSVNYLLDYFVLRVDKARDAIIASIMKLPVIGGLTQAEGVALGAYVSSGRGVQAVPHMMQGIHGVFLDDGTYAPAPTERVHSCLAWMQQAVIERIHAGGCKAPPPVQSVIQGVLSDCMTSFEQCKKLVDTPFPFPWAQAMCVLVLYAAAAPFLIVAHTTNVWIAVAITFAAVQSHIMLNEASTDIEDPFHDDPNELPLPQIQYKFNERLLAIAHTNRPMSFTDVGEIKGPGNKVQFTSSLQKTNSKAQPVPESVENTRGDANQNSFYAKEMPSAPYQAMLPQLTPRSAATSDYDGAMSLPSSIAPPKQGVPYIDKHELRYGAAYGAAEEGTFMTSGVIKSASSLSVPPLDTTGNQARTYWGAAQAPLSSLADGAADTSGHARSCHGPLPSWDSDFLQYSAKHQLSPAADNAASLHSMRWEPGSKGGQRGNSRRGSRYSHRAGSSKHSSLAPRPTHYKAQLGRSGGLPKHLVVGPNPERAIHAAPLNGRSGGGIRTEPPVSPLPLASHAEQAKAAGASTKRASQWSSRKLDQLPEAPRYASRHGGAAVELADNSGGSPAARLGSRHVPKKQGGAGGKEGDASGSPTLPPYIRPSPAVEKANIAKAFDILLGNDSASSNQPRQHLTQPQVSQPLRNSTGTARPITYATTFTPGERRGSKGAEAQNVAKRSTSISAATHSSGGSHSGTGSVSTAAPGENKREISFRNAIADLDGIVKNAGPGDESSVSSDARSDEDILPLMNRSQWPRALRDDTDSSRLDGSRSSDQRHTVHARGSSPCPPPQPSTAAARHTVGAAPTPSRRQHSPPPVDDSPHSPNTNRRSASQALGQSRSRTRSGFSPDAHSAATQSMDWRPPSRPRPHPTDGTCMSSATDGSGSGNGEDRYGDSARHVSLMGQASAYITGSRHGAKERAVRSGRARGQEASGEYHKHVQATNVLPSVRSTSSALTDGPVDTGMAAWAGARGSSPRQSRN